MAGGRVEAGSSECGHVEGASEVGISGFGDARGFTYAGSGLKGVRWTPSAGQFGRPFKVYSSLFCYPSSCGLQGRRCAEV
jgi:hypothetical protein